VELFLTFPGTFMMCTGRLPSLTVMTYCLWFKISTCPIPATFVICLPSFFIHVTCVLKFRFSALCRHYACSICHICVLHGIGLVCLRFSVIRFPVRVHFRLMHSELLQFPPLSITHSRVTVGKLFVHAVVKYFCCRLYLCYKFCPLDL
jgi:hypothetical protein